MSANRERAAPPAMQGLMVTVKRVKTGASLESEAPDKDIKITDSNCRKG